MLMRFGREDERVAANLERRFGTSEQFPENLNAPFRIATIRGGRFLKEPIDAGRELGEDAPRTHKHERGPNADRGPSKQACRTGHGGLPPAPVAR